MRAGKSRARPLWWSEEIGGCASCAPVIALRNRALLTHRSRARTWLGQAEICIANVKTHRVLGCIRIAAFNRIDDRNVFVEGNERSAGLRAGTVSIEPELIVEIVEQQIFQPRVATEPNDGGVEISVEGAL